jgi:hypothetical protein
MTHVEHVELAWRLLEARPFAAAFACLEERLLAVATAAGRPEKYDRWLSLAFLEVIDARRRPGEGWSAFLRRNTDLLENGRQIVHDALSQKLC